MAIFFKKQKCLSACGTPVICTILTQRGPAPKTKKKKQPNMFDRGEGKGQNWKGEGREERETEKSAFIGDK